jgi:hypothetical protein
MNGASQAKPDQGYAVGLTLLLAIIWLLDLFGNSCIVKYFWQ